MYVVNKKNPEQLKYERVDLHESLKGHGPSHLKEIIGFIVRLKHINICFELINLLSMTHFRLI